MAREKAGVDEAGVGRADLAAGAEMGNDLLLGDVDGLGDVADGLLDDEGVVLGPSEHGDTQLVVEAERNRDERAFCQPGLVAG